MARVSTDIKRAFVERLLDALNDGEIPTLLDGIKSAAKAQYLLMSTGQMVTARAGDGFSGQFAIINPAITAGVSQQEIAALWSELRSRHTEALAFLTKVAKYGLDADTVDESGWPDPLPAVVDPSPEISQDDIGARMLQKLVPAQQSMADYSLAGLSGVRFA